MKIDLSNFSINEFISYFLKTNFEFLNKFKISKIFNLIRPIQIWTPKMISKFKMNKKKEIYYESNYKKVNDKLYHSFLKNLNKDFFVLNQTNNILGFHYHNLNFIMNKKIYNINEFLKLKFGKNIICVDSSAVKDISVLPPTLSLIALAYYKTKNFCNEKIF